MKKCKTQVRRLTSFSKDFQPHYVKSSLSRYKVSLLAESVDEMKEEIVLVFPNEFDAIFVLSDENSNSNGYK